MLSDIQWKKLKYKVDIPILEYKTCNRTTFLNDAHVRYACPPLTNCHQCVYFILMLFTTRDNNISFVTLQLGNLQKWKESESESFADAVQADTIRNGSETRRMWSMLMSEAPAWLKCYLAQLKGWGILFFSPFQMCASVVEMVMKQTTNHPHPTPNRASLWSIHGQFGESCFYEWKWNAKFV